MASRWIVVVGVVVACAGCAAIVGLSDPGDAPPSGPETDSASGGSSGGGGDAPTEGGGTTKIGHGSGRDGPLLVADRRPINEYFPLAKNADVGARSLTLGKRDANTTIIAVRPGDVLLVIQSAAFGLKPDSGAYPLAADEIGRWELVSVDGVNGNVVETASPLVHAFSASGGQVVLVKQYTTVEIAAAGAITAPRWDGFSGGVIAFLATGPVTVNGQIDATNAGFRGARVAQLGAVMSNCSQLEGLVDAGFAPRGEGYGSGDAGYGGLTGGRGNFGNGGGGGDCHNSGGAGGGNGGRGGGGGDSYDLARPVGGMGGADLALTPGVARLRFGGGGGAGESNDNQQGNGGAGGGVVFVRAAKLTGSGFIYARGGGGGTTSVDGAGGGGAGGTVYLDIAESPMCKAIGINGGGGGNAPGGTGPGGGGGGGVVYMKGVFDAGVGDASTCPIEWNAGAPGTDGVTRRGAGPPDNERGETPYVGVATEDLAP